uniref:CSC1/OSCA1-like 7TM region domain-containing protein n=2 Tax=Entomoneis paludosa TaxID=265537 RepID=A0A7S2Y2R3_9STRA|mmetsp:Transcript_1407/g.3066  ORF Transcript_1407/g.3066 Transcript_1407/m.3066 type:complete len:850 (+) Transcript_1407:191-2740(+)|eukprot:CAMPEP_0172438898 /NCGR_PEP_ID=MMETSP1065-20121228/22_1 /TAXON_ID=265537 /ORGANISM="Amphiprora paludosa, Strain CCMP125" /LENGTH=849 /DNA_ID=CAMNT_0013187493 /DNA_START=114 /DNA_END=2663 /DNA_ORIENTATION=-
MDIFHTDHRHRILEDTNDDDGTTKIEDSELLRNTFMIYGSIFAIVLVLYCWLRRQFPKSYAVRSWAKDIKTDLANDQFGFFSWLWKVHQISEDEIMEECGMDAVCYLRLIRMGYRISAVGVFDMIWLLPIYYLAEESSETASITDGIVKTTIAHVPAGSSRMYATIIAAYFIFGYAMYAILKEMEWYIEMRHKYLKKPLPQHFAVFCRNIPKEVLDNTHLEQFFGSCFSDENVLEARVPMKISNLEKEVAKRDETLEKLEHALAVYQKDGERPQHKEKIDEKKMCGPKELVDSINFYTAKLEEENKAVEEHINHLQEIAIKGNHEESSKQNNGTDIENPAGDESSAHKSFVSSVAAKTSNLATSMASKTGSQLTHSLGHAVSFVTGSDDGELYPSGFVVFKKISTANAALQMIHHRKPFTMEVIEAPNPKDVYWGNVGRTHKDLQLGRLGSFAATSALCLLWTIPMSFFASLSNAGAAREDVEFLDDLFDKYPGLIPVLEQLAPFLVVIFNALLPIILEQFTLFEGPVSSGVVASSKFIKLAAFMIIQTFFVSAISGSIFQAISDIIDDWTEIIDLLANALPAQGTYFMQIILVTTTLNMVFELPRLVAVVMAFLRKYLGPNLTEKERSKAFMGLRAMSDPAPFIHPKFTSQLVLYFIILFVYAVISPITPLITGICFLFMSSMYKHQFIFNYPKTDSGGKLFANFIQIAISCMLIAQITIFGLLGLKKAAKQLPIYIPLLCITILFNMYIKQMHFRVAQFLPTHEGLTEDLHLNEDFDYSFLEGAYIQPALAAEPRLAPDASLTENIDTNKPHEEALIDVDEGEGLGENVGSAETEEDVDDEKKNMLT